MDVICHDACCDMKPSGLSGLSSLQTCTCEEESTSCSWCWIFPATPPATPGADSDGLARIPELCFVAAAILHDFP